jgi:hypothetical protein
MPNSFSLRSQHKTPGKELRFNRGGESVVARNGELQGWDKKDLMNSINVLLKAAAANEIDMSDATPTTASVAELKKNRMEMLTAAYANRSGGEWAEIGSSIAGSITQSADREGFMRRLLMRADLNQGNFPRIRVRKKDVMAVMMASASMVQPQYLRDYWLFPPEFYTSANIRVEKRELDQGTGDLLEEKFFEGQESIMVAEDRYWKKLADNTVGVDNQLVYLTGGLNPSNFTALRTSLARWNITPMTCVMSADYWDDITGNTDFSAYFDPVSKYEIVQTGTLGSLMGLTFITDGFRQSNLQVLLTGEMYMVGAPEMHGAYTDRGPVESNEVNQYDDGVPARGWFMNESLSMVIANARSVIKGIRN